MPSSVPSPSRFFLVGLVLWGLLGCADAPDTPAGEEPDTPAGEERGSFADADTLQLRTRADSVAFRAVAASGGFDAWHALPALRFEFGIEREGQQRIAARHYWDKTQNRYRVEWPGGGDTTYVAIFSAWPDSVRVYTAGQPLDGAAADAARASARRRTINDTYWLLAPLKLFDPGVTRTYDPDSSDATTDALRLSFDGVGMTPGDRYWLFIDKASGQLQRWTFVLEADPTPRSFDWTAYQTLPGPRGPVYLSARKQATFAPSAILTDALRAPATVDATLFSDPNPRL